MRVTIRETGAFDVADVIRRSPVANVPDAQKKLTGFMVLSAMTCIGEFDGRVACVWGVIQPSILSGRCYLWLLTTDLVDEHKFMFIRSSQRYIEKLLQVYPIICGDTDPNDHRAIRWLRLLGADFGFPVQGKIPFEIRAK